MRDFVIMRPEGGDWVALYMDGKLIAEGHSLDEKAILDAIADVFPNRVTYQETSDEKAEDGFAEDLSDMYV